MGYKAFILLAAGSSNRMNHTVSDKVLAPLLGKAVFSYSLSVFIRSQEFSEGVIVYRDELQRRALEEVCETELSILSKEQGYIPISLKWAQGGKRRQDSSLIGIQTTSEDIEWVYIHDCARPCLTLKVLKMLIKEASKYGSAILVNPMIDTVKQQIADRVLETVNGEKSDMEHLGIPRLEVLNMPSSGVTKASRAFRQRILTLPREELFCAQTPQAFPKAIIMKALLHALQKDISLTDDASALEAIDYPIHMVTHTTSNPKLTYPHDFLIAEAVLRCAEQGT